MSLTSLVIFINFLCVVVGLIAQSPCYVKSTVLQIFHIPLCLVNHGACWLLKKLLVVEWFSQCTKQSFVIETTQLHWCILLHSVNVLQYSIPQYKNYSFFTSGSWQKDPMSSFLYRNQWHEEGCQTPCT